MYIDGGKIPIKAEPGDKRKFERCETDIRNCTPKLRKKEGGGSEKMVRKGGKIQNMEETEQVMKGDLSNQTTDGDNKWQTELNKWSNNLETISDRHETHSERNLRSLDLKRKNELKIQKVQEQKGEGGSEGHFEVANETISERSEKSEELYNFAGGASIASRQNTRKNSSENFKGGPFRLEEKGQQNEQTELHMLKPYQT